MRERGGHHHTTPVSTEVLLGQFCGSSYLTGSVGELYPASGQIIPSFSLFPSVPPSFTLSLPVPPSLPPSLFLFLSLLPSLLHSPSILFHSDRSREGEAPQPALPMWYLGLNSVCMRGEACTLLGELSFLPQIEVSP